MAAKRLGFDQLHAALNDDAPSAFKDGYLDATAWPIRPFHQFALPLAEAMANGEEFEVMALLRKMSPLLNGEAVPKDSVSVILAKLRTSARQTVHAS